MAVRVRAVRRRFLIARKAFRMRHPKKPAVRKTEIPRFPMRFARMTVSKKELGVL